MKLFDLPGPMKLTLQCDLGKLCPSLQQVLWLCLWTPPWRRNVKSWKGSMNKKGCLGCWNCWTGGRIWIVCLRLVSSASDIFLYVLSRKWYIKDEKNIAICQNVDPKSSQLDASCMLHFILSLGMISWAWTSSTPHQADPGWMAKKKIKQWGHWTYWASSIHGTQTLVSCILSTLNQGWRFTWGFLLGHLPRTVHHPPH